MGLAHTNLLGAQFAGKVILHRSFDGKDQIIGTSLVVVQGGHIQGGILLNVHTGFLHQSGLHSSDVAVLELVVGHELTGQVVLDELIDVLVHILHLHGVDQRLTRTSQTHAVVGKELGAQQGCHS